MELKPGYKQTEVGVIPEDWNVTQLGKCLAAPPSYGINAPAVPYSDQLPVYIRITDISNDGSFMPDRLASVGSGLAKNYYLSDGDIVLARTGASVGKSYLYDPSDGPLVFAGFLIRVRPEKDKLLPSFAAAYITTEPYWRWVRVMSMRSGQPGINGKEYSLLPIPLPCVSEQSAITAILNDLDTLLSDLKLIIGKKKNIKQAAMQELLTGKRRLPGFEGEWEVKRLGDVGEIKSGGTPSTSQRAFWDGGVPWCTPTDITALDGRKYLTTTARTISSSGLQASSAEIIPPQSLIMTTRATIGECAINTLPMTTNQGFKNMVPSPVVGIEFLYYLMSTQKQRLVSLCGGSTFLEIGKKELSAYEIRLPLDRLEQDAISSTLSAIDDELQALEASLGKAENLKQGMMQQLLTGKIRLT